MALQIIGRLSSNFVRAVCMVAQEKGVPYEKISAAPHSDEVKALNPLGLILAMRHGGLDLLWNPQPSPAISTPPLTVPR